MRYWVGRGYTYEESIKKVSDQQRTFSKEKCILKYGEKKGLEIFTKRQKKWQKSLNENGNFNRGHSKISQDLFYEILNYFDYTKRKDIFFATHNGEYTLLKKGGGLWLYDFVYIRNQKIIEYNGDQYHANPSKFSSDDTPHPFRKHITAKEIWLKDEEKISTAKENKFDVLVIWDSEYRWGDKNKVIDKCLEFLGLKD